MFKHCDPAGIVFYPRYFEMINDCVETYFDEVLAYPFHALHEASGLPTVKIETTFQAPSRHGDWLDFALTPTRIGKSSLDLTFLVSSEGETRLTAKSTLVHIKHSAPHPWPESVRSTLILKIGDSE